jgi:ribosome-associated translation inhibitor RaiA
LLSQGNPMTLVVMLLKLMLVSKNSRTHLEARIADLLRYYQEIPEQDCRWVVNFLEIFNVTFTIYGDNVQYNLIRMKEEHRECDSIVQDTVDEVNLDSYRVFSQLRSRHLIPEEVLEMLEPEAMILLSGDSIDREAFSF